MSSPFIESSKARLLKRSTAELKKDAGQFMIPIDLNLSSALSLIGILQLALRHPAMDSGLPSVKFARQVIDGLIGVMKSHGFPATAEMAALGDDPDYDEARRSSGAPSGSGTPGAAPSESQKPAGSDLRENS